MVLTIICKNASQHKEFIDKGCSWAGIFNYQILDPKHDEVRDKAFSLVLWLDDDAPQKIINCRKLFNTFPPSPDMPSDIKQVYLNILLEIKRYIEINKEAEKIRKDEVPPLKNLQEFLNSFIGSVVEIRLPDRRLVGIYPDNQRLEGKYDVEYHASTIVNLAKIFNIFDATEVVIKEL